MSFKVLNKCKNCGSEFETKFKVMYCSKECAHGIKKNNLKCLVN